MYRGRVIEVSEDTFYMEFEGDDGTPLGGDFYLHLLPEVEVGDAVDFDSEGMHLVDLGVWTAEDIAQAKAEGARRAAQWAEMSD